MGDQVVVALGFLQVGVASFIIPSAGKVFPGVLLARLLYAQGASALTSMISALLADYIKKKDLGKGTGLGLDVVNQIVTQHNGRITVNSKPGETIFNVCIPAK